MQLNFITLADAAQVADGKIYILGGGWDTITVAQNQPGAVHVAHVALSLLVSYPEMGSEHVLTLVLWRGEERLGQIGSAKLIVQRPGPGELMKSRRVMMSLPVQLAAAAGEYKIKVLANGTELGALGYSVVVRPVMS